MKIWDLRMGAGPRPGGSTPTVAGSGEPELSAGSGGAGTGEALLPSLATGSSIPLCLGSFKVGGDSSAGSGGGSGGGGSSGVGGLAMYGQQAAICYGGASLGVINLSPGGGSGGRSRAAVTRLLGLGGAPLAAPIRGLSILPLSRLFVVGTEDGWLRVCR